MVETESEFPEIKSGEQRAQEKLEENGGLPEDNPFTDVVHSLRDEGETWDEILSQFESLRRVLEPVGYEATLEMQPEWEVTIVTEMSGGENVTETETVLAPTAEDAEDEVETNSAQTIDSSQTQQVGVTKY